MGQCRMALNLRVIRTNFFKFHTHRVFAIGEPRESHTFKDQSGKKADNTTWRSDDYSIDPKALSQCHSTLTPFLPDYASFCSVILRLGPS